MAKYLDLTGLSHYDQKIKQYIAQHSGGSALYRHNIVVTFETDGGNEDIETYLSIIDSNSNQYTYNANVNTDNHEVVSGFYSAEDFSCIVLIEWGTSNNNIKVIGFKMLDFNTSLSIHGVGNVKSLSDTVTPL